MLYFGGGRLLKSKEFWPWPIGKFVATSAEDPPCSDLSHGTHASVASDQPLEIHGSVNLHSHSMCIDHVSVCFQAFPSCIAIALCFQRIHSEPRTDHVILHAKIHKIRTLSRKKLQGGLRLLLPMFCSGQNLINHCPGASMKVKSAREILYRCSMTLLC